MRFSPPTPRESGMMLLGCGSSGAGGVAGALDTLLNQGATLEAAYSQRLLRAAYTGAAGTLRGNGTGSPEADIGFIGGDLDQSAIATLIANGGGTKAFWKTWKDQSMNARHATQATTANQPEFAAGAHSKGSLLCDGSNDRLVTSSFSTTQPMFVFTVLVTSDIATFSYYCGSAGSSPGFMGLYYYSGLGGYCGTSFTPNSPPLMLTNNAWAACGVKMNGASSSMAKNNGTAQTGSLGTNGIVSGWVIGDRFDFGKPWNGSIAEQIIFSGDPTGLAGWSAFWTAAQAYYGL